MSLGRVGQLLRKDLRLGPRSPLLLWAVVVPALLTLLVRGVFGGLFEDAPTLGIVDEGASELVAAAQALEGVDVRVLDDPAALEAEVADGALDAGLVLPEGFDAAVRAGRRPEPTVWASQDSLAVERGVLTVAVLDLVRDIAGQRATVTADIVELGEDGLPLHLRLLPLLVMFAVAIPGGMVPAASLVEERERGTLQALLATPVSTGEVLLAKGALGILLGVAAGTVTLALNDVLGASPAALLLAVLLGAAMLGQVGLILGAWARDTSTLFAAWKGGGLLLFLPAVFFLWPDLPSWPAQLVPTYYVLAPAFAVGVEGAGLGAVAADLGVAAVVCAALVPLVVASGRRMEGRLVAAAPRARRGDAGDAGASSGVTRSRRARWRERGG